MSLKKNSRVLLLASYCDIGDPDCTDELPCSDCLDMCNVFTLDQNIKAGYVGEFQRLQEDAILNVPNDGGSNDG